MKTNENSINEENKLIFKIIFKTKRTMHDFHTPEMRQLYIGEQDQQLSKSSSLLMIPN